ncbi:MAG: hypothetical protein R3348_06740, partial [Xanthomonadales bacterium]|nr:hypothetical protein [Xanthomonadales bacterium]
MSRRQHEGHASKGKGWQRLENVLWVCASLCLFPIIAVSTMQPVVSRIPESGVTTPEAPAHAESDPRQTAGSLD